MESYYYEKCDKNNMITYPFFIDKLKKIQLITKKINNLSFDNDINEIICDKCLNKKLYQLGNIIWSNNLIHKITKHKKFPSEYFINAIINTIYHKNTIINPPICINPNIINSFKYIPLHYNKLLIIDALMKQGSHPRYLLSESRTNPNKKYIYSEHWGVISFKNNIINNIIVSTESSRIDIIDGDIFLPTNNDFFNDYVYLFHTHPYASTYGNRIKDGILYEFPSANDIYNFIKYKNEGKAQASIIVAPEGIYVIRQIIYKKNHNLDIKYFQFINKYTLKLEKLAIKNLKENVNKISDIDFFHKVIGSNFKYINLYNKYLEPHNIFIEYYPRRKINGEWCLRPINLQYVEESSN
ncbi:hypothetical protein QJ854_gp439 [Moumouvirus goulette]|uniref:Uncharacterized protein n=1 Tax=Moumouvirus goulette TaxID=1247379 RepID=M1PH27_9VIRU|nr:hypothetical protein QJ854_gp439 [Moumouvirus goulette]AGF85343.1 hypothetical protein glt_00534 [Moumouvirus goulette]